MDLGSPIQPRAIGGPIPLTAGQLRLWQHYILQDPPESIRTCAAAHRIRGPLNTAQLRKCLQLMVQRHETLRTRIVTVDGVPRQQVDPQGELPFAMMDLSNLSEADSEREMQRSAQEFVDERIAPSVGPLFAGRVWRLSSRDHVLILAVDHIVSDGFSFGILARELWTLYEQISRGSPLHLPTPTIQFADYAVWQHCTHEDWKKKHEPYWRERLTGAPCAVIPQDPGRSEGGAPNGARLNFSVGTELSSALRGAAKRERTLLTLIVLTAYAVVLSKWCDRDDFLLVFISHGRYGKEGLDEMMGLIAHDLYLRVQIAPQDTLVDLLKHLKMELSRAYEHLDFDRSAALVSGCNREPLFNWQNTRGIRKFIDDDWEVNKTLSLQPFPLRDLWPTKFSPAFYDMGTDIAVTVYYRPDILSPSTLDAFAEDFKEVAAHLVRQPNGRIGALSLRLGSRRGLSTLHKQTAES